MIDLHYAPTPNGWKISIMLEELGHPHRVIPVNIRAGEPNVKRWYAEVRARPKVQAGLAIGKFVKEAFDEEARRNMFGQRAKELAGRK
ncbi:hypothetical protein [Bradyrhizobium valentinum]|uniref:hypothetical protein n=1 Tax=Bradyrhizobium valentinum TaxID=1518501 RepID=UPI00070E7A44|nr:hypothetical protein [Bradyrhizobium valentinum]KRR03783.1 hypothetical protein CQ10_17640 [Bradyrhizobium valentinum]